jgi:hypothetical protein
VSTLQELLIKTAAPKTAPGKKPGVIVDSDGLGKLASAMDILAGQEKDAKKQILLKTAAKVIRQQRSREDYLVGELAGHMHKESASHVARDLVSKGIYTADELDQAVEKIAKLPNLSAVKAAMELVKPKKDLPIGQVEKVASSGQNMTDAERRMYEDPAIQFLMGTI